MIVLLALFVLSAAGVGAAFAVPGWSDLVLLAGPCLGASLFLLLRLRWRAGQAPAVPDRPRVVIDGSNVLYWQDNTPGIAPVRQVVARLEGLGYLPGVMFDANAGYLIAGKYLDDAAFIRLVGLPLAQIVVVPKGTQADGHILTAARDLGARIVTNDRYRDWADQFPEVRAPGHLIRGGYRDGVLWLDVADRGAPVLVPAASRTIQGKP